MMIYFNGDSHVAGTELTDATTQSMSAHLANLFDAEYINDAVAGSSVDQILQRTRYYINECKKSNQWPDLVVIGLADWLGQDEFVDGQYVSYNELALNLPDNSSKQRQQYYQDNIANNLFYRAAMVKYYNNVLYNLHTELFYHGVPHLFFNCVKSLRHDRDLITFDWAEFYLHPYRITFNYRDWCRYQGFEEITPGKFHYGSDANQAWAKFLYDHMQKNNLLTKDEYGSLYNLGRQRRRHHGPGVGEWDEELLQPPHS